MPNKDFMNFNFKNPVESKPETASYLEDREDVVKSQIVSKKSSTENRKAWTLVFLLVLSLGVLGTYTFIEIKENENKIAALKNQSVAGVNDTSTKNIITAESFSLILDEPTPSNFKLQRKAVESTFLDNKPAVQTDFLGTNTKAGQDLLNGIEVQISEYDNKLDKNLFEEKVLARLGNKYEIKSRDISIPKDIKVTKIQLKNGNDDEAYYVTVTEDNYYILKVYNQSSRYSEFADTTKFTENLLPNLYLN